ncbi:BTB/Kelch-associated, partial [Aphelenchoides avenae]
SSKSPQDNCYLRWIYGDKAVVDSIRSSTYIAVLLAADRFGVNELVSRLIVLAERLLRVSLFHEIIDVLQHQQVGCGDELTDKCLNYSDENAAALVKHVSFVNISHELLEKTLARNSLCIQEIDLYRVASKWAQAQLKRLVQEKIAPMRPDRQRPEQGPSCVVGPASVSVYAVHIPYSTLTAVFPVSVNMTSSDKKVLRIPMKDHLRNSPQPTDVSFVFHVVQGKEARRRLSCSSRSAARCFAVLQELASRRLESRERSFHRGLPAGRISHSAQIYGDEAVLDSICASTCTDVLLAADRFDIEDLVSRLVRLAEELLALADSFVYKILEVLEHRQIGCANELTEISLNFLDQNAATLMRKSSFLHMSHQRLMEILARDSLRLREIDLYRVTTKWARAQLK